MPPRGKLEVQVRFRMILPESAGLHAYEFPARAIEGGTFALEVAIDSKKAIKNVYSPLSSMDIVSKGDHAARCSYECKGRPPRDPAVFYALSDRDFGINLSLRSRHSCRQHRDSGSLFFR